jgi:predicted nucleotidyltransferase
VAHKDDVQAIVSGLRRRAAERKRRTAVRATEARRAVTELARRLVEVDPEISRIVLFGSLAEQEIPANEDFDIDLAVETERYLELAAVAEACPFPVDLVDLHNVREAVAREIRTYGTVLYDKRTGWAEQVD